MTAPLTPVRETDALRAENARLMAPGAALWLAAAVHRRSGTDGTDKRGPGAPRTGMNRASMAQKEG